MATIAQRPLMAPLPRNTPHNICRREGGVMLIIGVLGFAAPMLFGMHLGLIHSLLYLFLGAAAIWYGQNASDRQAVRFSLGAGAFLAFLGIAGLVFGREEISQMGNAADAVTDRFLWMIAPGWLEFGRVDHVVHLVLGTVMLLSAVLWEGRPEGAKGSYRGDAA